LKPKSGLFTVLLALACGSVFAQETLYVAIPAKGGSDLTGLGTEERPYATIGFAFLQAASGDTILVRGGDAGSGPDTFNECVVAGAPVAIDKQVRIIAEPFQLTSRNDLTIISGEGKCDSTLAPDLRQPTVRIGSGDSTLQGFTITKGGSSGIEARGSVVITNNVITDNYSTRGGGIYFYSAAYYYAGNVQTVIANNLVTNNVAEYGYDAFDPTPEGGSGGGIYIYAVGRGGTGPTTGDVVVTITSNTISGNTATESVTSQIIYGAGLSVYSKSDPDAATTVIVSNNVITNNTIPPGSSGYGGGAWVYTYGYGTDTISMTNNAVAGNTAPLDGGGISAWSATFGNRADQNPTTEDSNIHHAISLRDNTITGNTSEGNGGGLDLYMLARNLQDEEGTTITVRDNKLTGNVSNGSLGGGGGVGGQFLSWRSATDSTKLVIEDNVIQNNTARTTGGGVSLIVEADSAPPGDPFPVPASPAEFNVTLRRNLIADNDAHNDDAGNGQAGGFFTYLRAFEEGTIDLEINQCTIADNTADIGVGGVHIETFIGFDTPLGSTAAGNVTVLNSIVWSNTDIGIGGPVPASEPGVLAPGAGDGISGALTVSVSFSDVFGHDLGNYDTWLTNPAGSNGNISADPLLSDDLLLLPAACSLTIDAADPALDFVAEQAPNGARANMGHTGGTADGTASLADLNGDNLVDGIDVLRVSVASGTSVNDPDDPTDDDPRFDASVDTDSNGMIDGVDLMFVTLEFGQSCPPTNREREKRRR